ncbi:MAG: hypothetical protein ACOY7J_16875, partial [Pseudomonadota bacterium]
VRFGTLCDRDVAEQPPGMGSRRVPNRTTTRSTARIITQSSGTETINFRRISFGSESAAPNANRRHRQAEITGAIANEGW